MPATVFISHAAADKAVAVGAKTAIEDELLGGVECFVSSDRESIPPGSAWFEQIHQALRSSKLMLVLCSPVSVNRPWINFEAGAGFAREIPVIPVCIRGLRKDQLPHPLSNLQAIDAQDEADIATLLRALATCAGLSAPRSNDVVSRLATAFQHSNSLEVPPSPPEIEDADTVEDEDPLDTQRLPDPEYPSSTLMFDRRAAGAFPGVRGLQPYGAREGVARLERLLHAPLSFLGKHGGTNTPIMWLRGLTHLHVDSFRVLSEETNSCLMGWDELLIDSVALYRSRDYHRTFVYVETHPDSPTGAYDTKEEHIDSMVKEFGYAWEEAGLWNGHYVTAAEVDDGYAEIDGKIIELDDVQVRCRYLSRYNFLLVPFGSPFNDSRWDSTLAGFMRGLLDRSKTLEQLVEWFEGLPRNQRVLEIDD